MYMCVYQTECMHVLYIVGFCMHTLFCIVNTLVSVVFIKEVFIFLTFSLRIRTHWLVFEADCDVLYKYWMSCYCTPCLLLNVWKSSPELLVYFVMFSWKCFVKPCWVMLQSDSLHTHTQGNWTAFCSRNNFDTVLEDIAQEAKPQKESAGDGARREGETTNLSTS